MYHLTCPTCTKVTESPFVRSGAVVRCTSCQNKFRIKTSHFERVIHTGPRTLDEADSVLRSDSVDIDPDEVAPVSIDDDGNVVGLSGLSELMRWSDDQGKQNGKQSDKEKLEARLEDEANAPPISKPKPTSKKTKPAAAPPEPADRASQVRARMEERKRKQKNKLFLVIGAAVAVVLAIGITAGILLSGPSSEPEGPGTAEEQPKPPDTGTQPKPPDIGTQPDTPIVVEKPPDQPDPDTDLFPKFMEPETNPDPKFEPPWLTSSDGLPTDVPTVLIPGTRVTFEGWYVMFPPRGAADAVGVADVTLGDLTPTPLEGDSDITMLTGSVTNRSTQYVLRGELHVMLLDSSGRVFAETFNPLVMIEPGAEQPVSLPIASRHWKRTRGVRAGVNVTGWTASLSPILGARVGVVGENEQTCLRISVRNTGKKPLKNVLILVSATDAEEESVADFFIAEDNVYVKPGGWLDLVVSTPLNEGEQAVQWSTLIQPY